MKAGGTKKAGLSLPKTQPAVERPKSERGCGVDCVQSEYLGEERAKWALGHACSGDAARRGCETGAQPASAPDALPLRI